MMTNLIEGHQHERRSITSAPRDGSTVLLPLSGWVRAYWDDELQTWVLCHPLHMESIRDPTSWRPENEK